MAVYSFLDLVHEVYRKATHPRTYREVWQTEKANGLTEKNETSGKIQSQSLAARPYFAVQDNENSRFMKVG